MFVITNNQLAYDLRSTKHIVYCEKAFYRSQIQLLMTYRTLVWKYHEIQTPGDYPTSC
jgi:hypothetical protein